MSIGSESIRRAAGAIGKTQEKQSGKAGFACSRSLAEIPADSLAGQESAAPEPLQKSVAAYGILCPVLVLREGETLRLLDGRARLAAALTLGHRTLPAVVLTLSGEGADGGTEALETGKDSLNELHEAKFRVIAKIGDDLPAYLL